MALDSPLVMWAVSWVGSGPVRRIGLSMSRAPAPKDSAQAPGSRGRWRTPPSKQREGAKNEVNKLK